MSERAQPTVGNGRKRSSLWNECCIRREREKMAFLIIQEQYEIDLEDISARNRLIGKWKKKNERTYPEA